jgi:hypothetical protein
MFWAGLLVGVSFLATPVKFEAESLSRPVALDVGRATFHLMSKAEIGLAIGLVALAVAMAAKGRLNAMAGLLVALVIVLVALQAGWLLPQLDTRVAAIIDGQEPPSSHLHLVYVVAEVAKLAALLLIAAGIRVAPAPSSRSPHER